MLRRRKAKRSAQTAPDVKWLFASDGQQSAKCLKQKRNRRNKNRWKKKSIFQNKLYENDCRNGKMREYLWELNSRRENQYHPVAAGITAEARISLVPEWSSPFSWWRGQIDQRSPLFTDLKTLVLSLERGRCEGAVLSSILASNQIE